MRAYDDLVIAAVLPKKRPDGSITSHLDYVLNKRIDGSYFQGSHLWLWKCAIDASLFSGGLDEEMVAGLLDSYEVKGDDKQKALILYLDLAAEDVSFDKIKVVLPQFVEEVHADRLGQALNDTVAILTDGLKVERDELEGYKDARQFLMRKMSELDTAQMSGTGPAQDIRLSGAEVLEEYQRAKQTDVFGIPTGFKALDTLTGGIQRGELWVMCGYTGEGKSQFMHNVGYHACVRQAKNVVLASLEMPVPQVRRRTFVRHTNHTRFGLPGGVHYERVKKGSLTTDHERIFFDAVNDFSTNPDYGRFHVLQVGRNETVPALRERLTYIRSRGEIDLVIVDYASLMSGTVRRQKRQDEIIEVIESLKSLALTFNEGEGLAILTANQISREAKEEANEKGRYGINFASETSAIEKNADLLGWILRNDEMQQNHEAKVGVAKYRDGATDCEFTAMEWFASGLLADLDDDESQFRF